MPMFATILSCDRCAVPGVHNSLGTKFNVDNIYTFRELKYFTGVTRVTINSSTLRQIDLRNITSNPYGSNMRALELWYYPNLVTSSCLDIGSMGVNRMNDDTDTAYYLPKMEAIGCMYSYGSYGKIRWFVIGTDNGCKVCDILQNQGLTSSDKHYVRIQERRGCAGIFVPDELVDAYKADPKWSDGGSSLIHGISEFKTLVTDVTGEELPTLD